jgi:hypothetical protein
MTARCQLTKETVTEAHKINSEELQGMIDFASDKGVRFDSLVSV